MKTSIRWKPILHVPVVVLRLAAVTAILGTLLFSLTRREERETATNGQSARGPLGPARPIPGPGPALPCCSDEEWRDVLAEMSYLPEGFRELRPDAEGRVLAPLDRVETFQLLIECYERRTGREILTAGIFLPRPPENTGGSDEARP